MQLHISPSLRHVTLLPAKGVRDLIKVKVGSRRISHCRVVICSLTLFVMCLWLVFGLSAMEGFDVESDCSSLGCQWRNPGTTTRGRRLESLKVPEEIYRILTQDESIESTQDMLTTPQTLEDFLNQIKNNTKTLDAETFALRLKAMLTILDQRTRTAKIHEYLYRHVASTGIPNQLHCLALTLTNEYSSSSSARRPLPSPTRVPALVDDTFRHYVLASDNVLAASVVAGSLVRNARRPEEVVVHVVTDRKSHAAMHAWFSLHPLEPAVVEVKGLHHFDWFTKGRVPVLEAMEKDRSVRSQFRGGSKAIVESRTEEPYVVAAKLQALSPKYNSLLNHIRIYLPELFPSLKKVIFLDDDVVVQSDLSPLWDIDLEGKVNGAVETCRGNDKFVMSKKLKSYLNFSHPLISTNFDPDECAWAYGMNIFDLDAWRKTNISRTYHHWVDQNLKSDLSLWQLGTLPPGLIAFHGHVRVIDAHWHMLGLGYQENTSIAQAQNAAVIHFNGRAKPWLEIAFPELRKLWTKYVDFSDRFIRTCNIR